MIFDTNAFIAWTYEDGAVTRLIADTTQPTLTLFTVAELYSGALNSGRPGINRKTVDTQLTDFEIVIPDFTSADYYAIVCRGLRKKGRHIPDNDISIAALALQHGFPVVTRDKHFEQVAGLTVVGW